jgi:hypothetical protein
MFAQQSRRGDRGPGEQMFDFSFHGDPAIGRDNRPMALRFRGFYPQAAISSSPGQLL